MPTATNKTFKRREWSPQDVMKLKQASKKKIPVKKIAKTLRRTEGACRQKAFSIGLPMNSTYNIGPTKQRVSKRTGTHG
jgi:hypothetical protein